MLFERAAECGIFYFQGIAILVAAGITFKGKGRAGGSDDKLLRGIANLKHVVAPERNAHRGSPGIIVALQNVGSASGPAAQLRHPLRHGRLPLFDLIAMRKERLGNRQRGVLAGFPSVKLCFGDGLNERACIRQKGEPFLAGKNPGAIGHCLQIGTGRMQGEIVRWGR